MDEPGPDHFEMRRLESLSNTIFGVAMTLLAYDLPRAAQFSCISWKAIEFTDMATCAREKAA
jgi:geranylgeranyl pyrophosphate synthase